MVASHHISRSRSAASRLLLQLVYTCALAFVVIPLPSAGELFFVTTQEDDVDDTPGDGTCHGPSGCSLRAAVQEANALVGKDKSRFRLSSGLI